MGSVSTHRAAGSCWGDLTGSKLLGRCEDCSGDAELPQLPAAEYDHYRVIILRWYVRPPRWVRIHCLGMG